MKTAKMHVLSEWLRAGRRKLRRLIACPFMEWVMLCACLLPFLLISCFNHPTDDDFHDALLARHLGLWESIQFYYMHWTGRYTSSFLYALVYRVLSLQTWLIALRLIPIVLIAGLLGVGRFALGALPYPLSGAVKWQVAGYGLVLYLYGIPLVSSALYWFNGAAVYTSGIILLLALLGLAGRCHRATAKKQRIAWGVLGAGAALMVAGTNELFMVAAVAGLMGWVLLSSRRFWPLIILSAAIIGAAVSLWAPGNLARAATNSNTMPIASRLMLTGAKAVYLTGAHLVQWSSSGVLLAATGLWLLTLPAPAAPAIRWQWLGPATVSLGLLIVLTFPTLWFTNDVPARIWNALYFIFLLSWFAVCTIARPLPATWQLPNATARRWRVGVLLVILLAHNTPVHQAYIDVAFKARAYNATQHRRYQLLRQAQQQGQAETTVPPLFTNEYQYPATIFLHDLEPEPEDIANAGMASYFGLDSVRVQALPLRTKRHFEQ